MTSTITLNQFGLCMPEATLKRIFGTPQRYNDFLATLTLKHESKIGAPKIYFNYRIMGTTNNRMIFIPRMVAEAFLKTNILKDIACLFPVLPPINITMKQNERLSPNQELITNYIINLWGADSRADKGLAACTINLGAGQGKTYVGCGLAMKLRAKTLYITPTKYLMGQVFADLTESFECAKIIKYDDS